MRFLSKFFSNLIFLYGFSLIVDSASKLDVTFSKLFFDSLEKLWIDVIVALLFTILTKKEYEKPRKDISNI